MKSFFLSIVVLCCLFSGCKNENPIESKIHSQIGLEVNSLAVSGSMLFAATRDSNLVGCVYRSSNNGASWTPVNTGLTGQIVNVLSVSGANIYAGTYDGGIYCSVNQGNSWSKIASSGSWQTRNKDILAFVVSGKDFFVATGEGIFRSSDNGVNWVTVINGLEHPYVSAFAVSGNNLFAGSSGGVYKSTNNGENWARTTTTTDIYSLIFNGANLFAGTSNTGIWRSADNGASWIQTLLPSTNFRTFAISGQNIFVGTDDISGGGGVFVSKDNGETWTVVNNGLTTPHVLSLAVIGTNIFAGTYGGGVFLSTDNGTSWTPVNTVI